MTKFNTKPALLTRTEIEWLLGELKVSKTYEYRMKSDIRKKLRTFSELELPLLLKERIIDRFDLSKYTQNLRTNPKIANQDFSFNSSNIENCAQNMVGREG